MQLASGSLPPAGGASGASHAIGSVNFFLIVSLVDPRYRWSESLGPLLAGALVTMFCQCTLCSCSATDTFESIGSQSSLPTTLTAEGPLLSTRSQWHFYFVLFL